jgi:curved DNA-binding protein CbpA
MSDGAVMSKLQDHYDALGVTPEAPDEVIRAAYRALVVKYHPDRNPGDSNAELRLKRVNAAFRVLGDPKTRKLYDDLTRGPSADPNDRAEASTDNLDAADVPHAATFRRASVQARRLGANLFDRMDQAIR